MQTSLNFRTSRLALSAQRWWQDPSIRIPMLIFVAARILTLVIAVTAVHIAPVHNPWVSEPTFVASLQGRQLEGPLNFLLEPWHRWDTGYYLKIAVRGYAPDDSIIFAPLYPVLIAVTGAVVGDTLLGGLLVSSAACLAFLIVFYRLARRETGSHAIAQNTLIAYVAFPTAFYLMAAYTESLFLALAAGALLAARNRRWWLAAFLVAGATLSRLQGWILFFPIGWMAFVEAPRFWQTAGIGITWLERLRQAIPRLAAVGAGLATAAGFVLYLSLSGLGSLDEAYEKYWQVQVRPPWAAVIDVIGKVAANQASATEIAGLIALVFIVALGLLSLRVLPTAYHLYIWPTLIFILLRYYPLYLLNGIMRYVLDFFPIFITAGAWLARRPVWRLALIVTGALVQMIMLFLFARWMWVA
jgi:Mannosyltransferase (PIG-V)